MASQCLKDFLLFMLLFCLLLQVPIGLSSLAFKELDMTIKIAFIAIIQCIQVYSFILDHSFAFTGLKFGIIILTKSAFI